MPKPATDLYAKILDIAETGAPIGDTVLSVILDDFVHLLDARYVRKDEPEPDYKVRWKGAEFLDNGVVGPVFAVKGPYLLDKVMEMEDTRYGFHVYRTEAEAVMHSFRHGRPQILSMP